MKRDPTKSRRADERQPIRTRWMAGTPDGSDEAIAGALLRAAAAVRPFGPREEAEVAARLRGKPRWGRWPLAWQIALAVALILFGSGLSAGVTHVLQERSTAKPPNLPPVRPAARAAERQPARHRTAAGTSADPAATPDALPTPALQLPPVAEPPLRPRKTLTMRDEPAPKPAALSQPPSLLTPPPTALPEAGTSALAQQSRLIASALRELRHNGDADKALALLDRYGREFGRDSALGPEANATRIEALLKLGRHDQALALLDGMASAAVATGIRRELLIARAELRADKNRRVAALHDFDLLLASGAKSDEITERALWGRASCRAKNSDTDGARRDLEAYLARFPDGIFAKQARAALGNKDE